MKLYKQILKNYIELSRGNSDMKTLPQKVFHELSSTDKQRYATDEIRYGEIFWRFGWDYTKELLQYADRQYSNVSDIENLVGYTSGSDIFSEIVEIIFDKKLQYNNQSLLKRIFESKDEKSFDLMWKAENTDMSVGFYQGIFEDTLFNLLAFTDNKSPKLYDMLEKWLKLSNYYSYSLITALEETDMFDDIFLSKFSEMDSGDIGKYRRAVGILAEDPKNNPRIKRILSLPDFQIIDTSQIFNAAYHNNIEAFEMMLHTFPKHFHDFFGEMQRLSANIKSSRNIKESEKMIKILEDYTGKTFTDVVKKESFSNPFEKLRRKYKIS